MKIGILGTRGIPNTYGGFEQFAQYLAEGLEKKGHDVWVYNSSDHDYKEDTWRNIHIIHCKDMENKIGTAGQFIYDFNCIRDARKRKFDILLQLGYTSNSIWHFLWPKKTMNIVNMDGLEWKRSKYNKPTQLFLQHAEKWAARHADVLIADSIGIQDYIKQKYQLPSIYIPYGATIFEQADSSILNKWKIEPKKYFLAIARMEPENNIEMIIQGYCRSAKPYPLVLVGNTHNGFGQYLRKKYDHPSILFTEGIYDENKINNLRFFSKLYFHGHSVGGTNPSLLEAMACSCSIVAHLNNFNKAILTDDAYYFEKVEDIAAIINKSEQDDTLFNMHILNNLQKIKNQFNWPKIIDDYESMFMTSLSGYKKIRQ